MLGPALYLVYHDIFKVDVSHVYGKDRDSENNLRSFKDGKLKFQVLTLIKKKFFHRYVKHGVKIL